MMKRVILGAGVLAVLGAGYYAASRTDLVPYSLMLVETRSAGVAPPRTLEEVAAANRRGDVRTAFWGAKRLADQGDASAQLYLAMLLELGRGTPKDVAEAYRLRRAAADRGDAAAEYSIGWAASQSEGDAHEARYWYERAAQQGFAYAQYHLAEIYAAGWRDKSGNGRPPRKVEALTWYVIFATHIPPAASPPYHAVDARIDRLAEELNPAQIAEARSAARSWKPRPPSSASLPITLENAAAAVQARDFDTANRMFRALADQGNPLAQYRLGILYMEGIGTERDHAEASRWLLKAADTGMPDAQRALGDLFGGDLIGRESWRLPQDRPAAISWYRKAADQGDAEAMFRLFEVHGMLHGRPGEALLWLRKAADRGYLSAQWWLGLAYLEGLQVPQDFVQAHKWFNLCAASASPSDVTRSLAIEKRDEVTRRLTPAQLERAQLLASEWRRQ